MSARVRVRAAFRIGPWVPGAALPVAVGLVGAAASLLVLREVVLAVGLVLAVASAVRVRSIAPWLLVAALALGQLLRDPDGTGVELPALVLLVHVLVVLTMTARALPVRARVQVAALAPAARSVGLVQLPAQVLAVLLLASAGRLQVVPAAAIAGAVLLLLVTGLLVVPRRPEEDG